MSGRSIICKALVILATLAGWAALAQDITGSISGTVKDSSGALVTNATVTLTNTDTGVVVRTVNTDSSGGYSAPLLPIGRYSVTVEAPGFKKSVQKNIELNVNDKLTINATMHVGGREENVTVEANPLQVDLQSATATGVVTGTEIRELSLNTRNYEQLVTLLPGVSSSQTTDQLYVGAFAPIGTNVVSFSINGARSSANNWTIDGADNVDRGSNLTLLSFPSVDAIEEFKVVRGAYDPEFGRSGGAQVNVVTRSGSNAFHGGVYEFFRNDWLNANNYFNKHFTDPTKAIPRPALRYNDFGGTLGGPVDIPGIYNGHNKTFFFFSEEFRRSITYANPTINVPTSAERSGTFAHTVCIQFNASGTCTQTGTQIAPGAMSPVASEYLKDIFSGLPLPNDSVDPHVAHLAVRSIFNFREEMLKIDHVFGPRLTVNGKYLHDSIPTTEPFGIFNGTGNGAGLPGVTSTSTNSPGHNYTVRTVFTATPTFLIEGGYGYSYGAIVSNVTGIATTAGSPDVKVPLLFTPSSNRIPSIAFSTAAAPTGFGVTGPYRDFNTNHSAFGSVTRIWGKHTFKAGGDYYHYQKNENAGNGTQGIFTINTTGQASGGGNTVFERTWANFLLGRASNFRQDKLDLTAIINTQQFEFYGQDEYRVKPYLALTYGVRYSNFRQPTDANNKLGNFDPRAYDPAKAPCITASGTINTNPVTCPQAVNFDPFNGFVFAGKNSPFGDKVSNEDNKNFAPRIGIAWDPFHDGKTSVRSGYGIFYDSILFGNAENDVFLNPAVNPTVNIPNTTLDNPGNAAVAAPSANPLRVRGLIASPYKTPYVQEWSLDIQRELTKSMVLDVGYYGSKGTHLLGILDINQPQPDLYLTTLVCGGSNVPPNCVKPGDPIRGATTPLLNRIRPFLGYSGIDAIATIFNSNYNSLQANLQKRFGSNSTINFAYTWAKSLTDNQTDRSTAPQNSYCIHCDYGPSQQDRRQIFTANYVYTLPFFKAQHGLVGHVAGGWEFSGITTFQTGLPFTVSSPFDADPSGQGCLGPSPCAVRPDMISNPNDITRTGLNWFNPNAFAAVPAGQFRNGTAGRGVVRGPGFERWDLSLFKNIKMTERLNGQFRFEAFNAFNHTNFNTVQTSMTSPTFGQVITARDPRIVQLGMKLNF
jgi:hypothetical protein